MSSYSMKAPGEAGKFADGGDQYGSETDTLRVPMPVPNSHVEHLGIIVEKSGEDNDHSKKQRVMYLYSKTIRKGSGRIVCSTYWRDFQLGDWIRFNVENHKEMFFKGVKVEPSPAKTRICDNTSLPMVMVRFYLLPKFIRARHVLKYRKLYSEELGLIFATEEQMKQLRIRYGYMYDGWVRYSYTQVCFDPKDTNTSDWPYEPNVYWELVSRVPDDIREIEMSSDKLSKYENEMYNLGVEETLREKELKTADRLKCFEYKPSYTGAKLDDFTNQPKHS